MGQLVEPSSGKYFSVLVSDGVDEVEYNSLCLPNCKNMPLVFKFDQNINGLKLIKRGGREKKTKGGKTVLSNKDKSNEL
jgi:hypothetical protein